jgi:hypothetical protein
MIRKSADLAASVPNEPQRLHVASQAGMNAARNRPTEGTIPQDGRNGVNERRIKVMEPKEKM